MIALKYFDDIIRQLRIYAEKYEHTCWLRLVMS